MRTLILLLLFALGLAIGPAARAQAPAAPADLLWRNATVYFLMTDRFHNGDPSNDFAYGRQKDGDRLRSFEGGDLRGVIQKLEDGYFRDLGVTAIWTTPVIEQVHQPFTEFGRTYAYHGYWPRDWTAVDAAFGTEADFAEMVRLAHAQGIRIIVDVIANHSGPPIGGVDPAWPSDWVRNEPACDYKTFATTATCLIVPALQDIRTESEAPAPLPAFLAEKWRAEGRLDAELAELDAFFARTGYPRAPKYYLIKWLTDWVRDYGVDGFRVDTAKHVDPELWAQLKQEAHIAFAGWKARNPGLALDDRPFFMVGEVFNFGPLGFQKAVLGSRAYDFGDRKVDFYQYGFDGLINMGFATHAYLPTPALFQLYGKELQSTFRGVTLLNYLASHDDMAPYDPERRTAYADAVKLILAPGAVQIYYGDELARPLKAKNTTGDAFLRTPIDWRTARTAKGRALLAHWRKLGRFRQAHPAVGAGVHSEHGASPLVFSRRLAQADGADAVLVGWAEDGKPFTQIAAGDFADGATLRDAYHGDVCTVERGAAVCPTPRTIALLAPAD